MLTGDFCGLEMLYNYQSCVDTKYEIPKTLLQQYVWMAKQNNLTVVCWVISVWIFDWYNSCHIYNFDVFVSPTVNLYIPLCIHPRICIIIYILGYSNKTLGLWCFYWPQIHVEVRLGMGEYQLQIFTCNPYKILSTSVIRLHVDLV